MKNIKRILMATAVLVGGLVALVGSTLVQAQEVRTYFITDAVGSPVIATDAYCNVTWSEDYLPYGERRYRSASSGANERWYTNAPQNEDTGLVDLGNRQYDPVIGRFLNIDPVGASAEQPFSINRYAYSNNNPYRYTDPHGNIPVDTIWDIGSVVYDLGKVAVGWSIGNQTMVVEGLGDAAADTAAMFMPYVPAGSTKIARMGARAADEAVDTAKAAKGAVEGSALTSRAARRDAMRDAGIPTSQQPISQSRNASGREYSYNVPATGGGTQRMSVQQQTMDRSHPGQAHWEAGRVKTDPLTGAVRENNYGRPALTNDKSKVDY